MNNVNAINLATLTATGNINTSATLNAASVETGTLNAKGDITTSAAAQSGPPAFAMAGVRPDEIDVAMIYDSFSITVAKKPWPLPNRESLRSSPAILTIVN